MQNKGKHLKLLDKYDCEVVEERYNDLIGRREIVLKILHWGEGSPSRGLIKTAIAKAFNTNIEQVFIENIKTEYGQCVSTVLARIYSDPERAKLFEPEYIIKRDEKSLQKLMSTSSTSS